ncbi:MAG: T9SS type A sorting domain-containing protein [Saprospiraceae bacterium]|nr:T9SS type A sorting domain-containing protein [Saprospiraceae bacterium]
MFDFFVDQAGFEIPGGAPEFLSPEWGKVAPFSLSADDLTIYNRNGEDYFVYHDPGAPAYLQQDGNGSSDDYKWNHSLVSIWSSHLDPTDNVMIDISPASIGNLDIANFPTTLAGLRDFYQLEDGGDPGQGYNLNPYTQQPYSPQIVPRADYARVLAEFWADGPDSETPPGHWFTILNTVNDHPLLEKKFKGQGPVLNDLEWDVKAYFTLGGTMHDAAISAWGIKGWYDYIRPISALRYMADQGQSSDPDLPNYSPAGIPLQDGYIELVSENDSLAGSQGEHIGKIKLYAWRGPDAIDDPTIDVGGVDWILAENWWPYQRPSFVTPPFAGYVSGHSTYSRAAAEVLTLFTGDAYFPGGLGEFIAEKDSFLVFEKGPSTNMVLQWAKYYDASDQCSLSRIWGGIHPPVDDIPGRLIGHEVGRDAFQYAEQFFNQSTTPTNDPLSEMNLKVFPNPAVDMGNQTTIYTNSTIGDNAFWTLTSLQGQELHRGNIASGTSNFLLPTQHVPAGFYLLNVYSGSSKGTAKIIVQ